MKMMRVLGGNLLILALLLTAGEGLASLLLLVRDLLAPAVRSDPPYIVYDAELGWVNTPASDFPDVDGPGVSVRTNAQGFRITQAPGPPVPDRVLDGRIRLLCSGDSFTFGYSVANEHTWCQQLAAFDPRLE